MRVSPFCFLVVARHPPQCPPSGGKDAVSIVAFGSSVAVVVAVCV